MIAMTLATDPKVRLDSEKILLQNKKQLMRFSVVLNGELTSTKISAEGLFPLPIYCIMGCVMKMDELKNRKTTRLKGADYNRNQAVFLTICTKERKCILSRVVGTGVPCQEQDCKQLCKRIVYTFYVQSLCFWKPNGA